MSPTANSQQLTQMQITQNSYRHSPLLYYTFAMLLQFTSKRVSYKQEKETCDSLQSLQRNLCIFQKIINFHALLLLSFFATSETSREFHTFTNLQFACRRELEKSEWSPLYLCQKNCVQIAIVKITLAFPKFNWISKILLGNSEIKKLQLCACYNYFSSLDIENSEL